MRLTIILLLVSAVCFGQEPASNPISIPDDGKVGASNPIEIKGDNSKVGAYNPIEVNDTPKVKAAKLTAADSLALPIFSTKEVMNYMLRIEKVAASIKNLRLTNDQEYNQLTAELNAIIKEMDKKRKTFK